jgi:hypothetical protein
VYTLQPHDPVIFVNWYLQSVHGGELDPELTLSGSIWTHEHEDKRYWSIVNPQFIHKVPFHDVKCMFVAL